MAKIAAGQKCTFCKHIYVTPCNGKNKKCQNRLWLTEGKFAVKKKKVEQKPKRKRVKL